MKKLNEIKDIRYLHNCSTGYKLMHNHVENVLVHRL